MPDALYLLLFLASLVVKVWALVDAVSHADGLYRAAGKKSKSFWVGVLVAAALLGWYGGPLGVLGLVGLVAAIVYLVDVRPALRELSGR